MVNQKENVISKDMLIARIAETILEEPKLIGKIIGQIKNAREKPSVRLNINEKQLRVHLAEVITKWEKAQISLLINKFLVEMKNGWQKGENIALWGIFSSQVYRTPARKVKNPQTGQFMVVPAKKRLRFRISSKLKREINRE
ncbi:MAG: HU family DNA-binding protein [Candidatus Moeniiplasma glomeromycotorum]|nr:HU family DNA-binding protein [Candidatus Moeniiplasma glomeromycotorum]MCE8162240.1 HU family DNA-binding protein [Candidatus Moeniiplasma glomeromycotorum]MCE8166104.1 HU family DNA-binding protein [Candidatus Moeniiplasma glomeromycotorum]MCE8166639.1 HU family DNA-binding protein [Candidatus Moeniiplasma glomeromycotorum]